MRRTLYLLAGWTAFLLGAIGIVLPLVPTVAFWVLAAFCFSRSSPEFEAWLLAHPAAGPHIRAWRERRAISRTGKIAATLALVASSGASLLTLAKPLAFLPAAVALLVGSWIWSRPH